MSRIENILIRISEASLGQLFRSMKDNDFAIISAFRDKYPLNVNKTRNMELITQLRPMGTEALPLKGGWSEKQDDGTFKFVEEDSLFIKKPDNMSPDDFEAKMLKLANNYEQDAVLVSTNGRVNMLYTNGQIKHVGDYPEVTTGDVEGAYSEYLGHKFVFKKNT